MRPVLLLAIASSLLAGCATAPRGGPNLPSWRSWEVGRDLERIGRTDAARERYRHSLAADPGNIDARIALVRLGSPPAGEPSEGDARLLAAIAIEGPAQREAALEALSRTSPYHPGVWRLLGEARLATGEFGEAERAFEESIDIFEPDGRAHDGLARARFLGGDWSDALDAAEEAVGLDPGIIDSQIFLAVEELVDRDYRLAILRLGDLSERRPDAPLAGEKRLVWWLGYDRALKRLAADRDWPVARALASEGSERFESASIEASAALAALETGHPQEAPAHLERALRLDRFHLEGIHLERRIAFAEGRYLEGLAAWERTVPLDWVLAEDNALAGRYREIYDAARAGDHRRLAEACLAAGWFEEAEALGLEPDPEVRAFRRFLADLGSYVHEHDLDLEAGRRSRSLDEFVADVAALWGEDPPFDLSRDLETWYVVVSENDPFEVPEGSLGAYLARYGYFFDLSDAQGWIDFRLMHAAARRPFASSSVLLADLTLVPSYDEFQWGDLRRAGRAFLSRNGFYVSADVLTSSRAALAQLARLALDPAEEASLDSPYDPAAARVLARRVASGFLEAGDPDRWDDATWDRFARRILGARVENTAHHELGHILDFRHLVPASSHLLANLLIAASHGFSPDSIHTRFERAAETYSVGASPNTALALLDNLQRLEIDPESLAYLIRVAWTGEPPEDSPYYEGARDLILAIAERAEVPRGTPAARWVAELAEDEVRRLAIELAAEEGVR